MMTESLMIGTRGWEVADWVGDFYPGDLPADWRFCYYSNNLRSVLVSQDVLAGAQRADIERWIEDSDPAFRFVLEVPAGSVDANARDVDLAAFDERVEPLVARIAGWLLRVAGDAPVRVDEFESLLNRFAQRGPVCVDLPESEWRGAEPLAALDRQGAGLVWHCAREEAPRPGGGLMVALAPVADARSVRHWIEKLAQWQGHHHSARAGLFFEPTGRSAHAAQEARLIAELMGV